MELKERVQRNTDIDINDVKVKSQEKALSLVNMHIQPQDHCAAPKEMLRAWYLGAGF